MAQTVSTESYVHVFINIEMEHVFMVIQMQTTPCNP